MKVTHISEFLIELQKAKNANLPFVAFKKPNELKLTAWFQNDTTLHEIKNYTESGFVFAPFDAQKKSFLLKPSNELIASFEVSTVENNSGFTSQKENVTSKSAHINLVEKTIDYILQNTLTKIVVARSKTISKEINFIEVFEKLIHKYSSAYVYVWFHPKVGFWMGATPETLVKVQNTKFQTLSLAGTQKFAGNLEVSWGEKELEEQQLVTDYVLKNLAITAKSIQVSKVSTVKAGALLHLQTLIEGELKENVPLEKMISVLHPTPAVCGSPKNEAQAFILANENFDRSFYTGFLGELNQKGLTHLFVNLRCMQLISINETIVYVGGGITAKSNPEKEWEETVAKTNTMESTL